MNLTISEAYFMSLILMICMTIYFVLVVRTKNLKWNHQIILGLTILWLGFIFNIVYTGLLGWNMRAASLLEQKLDIFYVSSFVFSIFIIFFGFIVAEVKDPKNQEREVRK